MITLLFSANYPGPHAAFWQYFGASLDHSVLALCFAAFAITPRDEHLKPWAWLRAARKKLTNARDTRRVWPRLVSKM